MVSVKLEALKSDITIIFALLHVTTDKTCKSSKCANKKKALHLVSSRLVSHKDQTPACLYIFFMLCLEIFSVLFLLTPQRKSWKKTDHATDEGRDI